MSTNSNIEESDRMARAVQAIERLQQRLERCQQAAHEPIAIIGLGCRFPGGEDLQAFWNMLDKGVDAISPVPADRWDADTFYDPVPGTPGRSITRQGGFITSSQDFDAAFFGLSPKEAATLDPQQRLLLEVSWEAMEQGGIVPAQWQGESVGVFVGISGHDYSQRLLTRPLEDIDAYLATGNSHSVAAGRISYTYGFNGPAISVDTACSSSLVALHLACRSLRDRECDAALVGGVNCLLSPEFSINFSSANMLAPDGRCKTFAASADGFARAEGCGVVVLKRLCDAQADGDDILAIVRGSAVNQDGKSGGLTVPNGPSQQSVIRAALKNARVKPEQIDYVEAHGTGTELGDPIEVGALSAVFGVAKRQQALQIGSLKTNLGHMEAAAGIGGVIKVVLSMLHQRIPQHLHFDTPSPHIAWADSPLEVTAQSRDWPADKVRLAGVSSFGFSGTNAHIVLQSALQQPEQQPEQQAQQNTGKKQANERAVERAAVLMLSAKDDDALRLLAQRYALNLRLRDDWFDVCWSAYHTRSCFEHRLAVSAKNTTEAAQKLEQFVADMPPSQQPSHAPRIGFLYTGQGSQLLQMGRGLYREQAAFREAFDDCAISLAKSYEIDLVALLYPDLRHTDTAQNNTAQNLLDQTENAQPALFAVAYSLTKCWHAWGIQPAAVLGHSIGEFAAAVAAGILELDDALSIVVQRGRLMQSLPQGGAMAVVFTDAQTVETTLVDGACIAATNSPTNTVISGKQAAVDKVLARLQKQGVEHHRLNVSHAFHSAEMLAIQADFDTVVSGVGMSMPCCDYYSTVAGRKLACGPEKAEYWSRQISSSVRYDTAIQSMIEDGIDVLIEIGAQAILLPLAIANNPDWNGLALPSLVRASLQRPADTSDAFMQAIASLYRHGIKPAWGGEKGRRVPLPVYAFNRRRHWAAGDSYSAPTSHAIAWSLASSFGLLQKPVRQVRSEDRIFPAVDDLTSNPLWQQHQVFQSAVLPAVGFIEMALSAARSLHADKTIQLSEISFLQVLQMNEATSDVQLLMQHTDDQQSFEIVSNDGQWQSHCVGQISVIANSALKDDIELNQYQQRCKQKIEAQACYRRLAEQGLEYGEDFCLLEQVFISKSEVLAKLTRPRVSMAGFCFHPVLLDACIQSIAALFIDRPASESYLPVSVSRVLMHAELTASDEYWSHITVETGDGQLTADLSLFDAQGVLCLSLLGLRMQAVDVGKLKGSNTVSDMLYRLDWQPAEIVTASSGAFDGALNRTVIRLDDGNIANSAFVEAVVATLGAKMELTNNCQQNDCQQLVFIASEAAINEQIMLLLSAIRQLSASVSIASDTTASDTAASDAATKLDIVTQGALGDSASVPLQAALWGLARTIELEMPQYSCRRIDLDPAIPAAKQLQPLIAELQTSESGSISFRHGERRRAVLSHLPTRYESQRPEGRYQLAVMERGTPDGLRLRSCENSDPAPGEIAIQVQAAGINFIDVLDSLGMLPFERDWLGVECSGVVMALGEGVADFGVGDRVMALAKGSFRDHINVPVELIGKLPDRLNMLQAATIPAAFLTAWYALKEIADVQPGEHVLIHAGTGGTGMAAIQVAKLLGAKVYATASQPKWLALRELGIEQPMDSRTAGFGKQLKQMTDGHGVDVILNSLTGEFITEGLHALASNGRFLEIGKRETLDANQLASIRQDVSYEIVDLMGLAHAKPQRIMAMFEILLPIFEKGSLRALPRTCFALEQAASAFQLMQRTEHIGKVVLSFADNGVTIDAHASYLVSGGFGALGLATANWLVAQGARYIVLMSRHLPEQAPDVVGVMRQAGAQVILHAGDVSRAHDVSAAIDCASKLAPLRGVIHAAGVLDDALLQNIDAVTLEKVMTPKLDGALQLHQQTRALSLDMFVLYSSAASMLGSPGQGAYVAANAFLDALAVHRHKLGLPALSVNWGPWSDAGLAANEDTDNALTSRGIRSLSSSNAFAALSRLLSRPEQAQAGVMSLDMARMRRMGADMDPLFERLLSASGSAEMAQTAAIVVGEWREEILTLPHRRRVSVLTSRLQKELALVLGMPDDELPSSSAGFFDMGLDSLMSVELRNRLCRGFDIQLNPAELFQHPNTNALSKHIVTQYFGSAINNDNGSNNGSDQPLTLEPAVQKIVDTTEHEANEGIDSDIANELAALDKLLNQVETR